MNAGKRRAARVTAVSSRAQHSPGKENRAAIRLIAGRGVEGDAHAGATVRHRSRVRRGASQPNLRQVHLIHAELHDELAARGIVVGPGEMGENITTRGIELLSLPSGAQLHLGESAVVEVTGLRNPCAQLDSVRAGLMKATLETDAAGNLVRKAGIMSVVVAGGEVRPGDEIAVEIPEGPWPALEPV